MQHHELTAVAKTTRRYFSSTSPYFLLQSAKHCFHDLSMSTAAAITCQNLTWSTSGRVILEPMTWSLPIGQRLGIIGPNGAGKSTLLKLLAGMLTPTSGHLRFNQQDLSQIPLPQRAKQIALLSQEQDSKTSDTVWQLVALGRLPHQRWYQSELDVDCDLITEALAATALTSRATSALTELSGGELQRAHLARIMVQQAHLWLLDEPTNHLDVHHQHHLLGLASQQARDKNITLIASFHDLNLAASYCDQLLLLADGCMLAFAPPAEVLTEPLLSKVYQRDCLVDINPFDGKPRVTFAVEKQSEIAREKP